MMSNGTDERLKIYTHHVSPRQNTEESSTREGVRSGVGRHERMKQGSGVEDREERSKGIEIRIADAFVIIMPTSLFKLAKHEDLRKRNWSDSSGNSFANSDASR